jgi:hypothetical protein
MVESFEKIANHGLTGPPQYPYYTPVARAGCLAGDDCRVRAHFIILQSGASSGKFTGQRPDLRLTLVKAFASIRCWVSGNFGNLAAL